MGLAKLVALLMVLLLVGSSFIGLIIYFIKMLSTPLVAALALSKAVDAETYHCLY